MPSSLPSNTLLSVIILRLEILCCFWPHYIVYIYRKRSVCDIMNYWTTELLNYWADIFSFIEKVLYGLRGNIFFFFFLNSSSRFFEKKKELNLKLRVLHQAEAKGSYPISCTLFGLLASKECRFQLLISFSHVLRSFSFWGFWCCNVCWLYILPFLRANYSHGYSWC